MNLIMVRHGEVPSNIAKVYAGKSNERLTPKGICQAEEVAEKLKSYNVHNIYSSPIQRALQTAEIIRDRTGIDIQINSSFREMDLGPWEGLSEEYIARLYPVEWQIWLNRPAELMLPGRETLAQLLKRVLAGIDQIYKDISSRSILILTHVAIIRVLLLWYSKKNLNLYKSILVPNAEIFEIKIDNPPFL